MTLHILAIHIRAIRPRMLRSLILTLAILASIPQFCIGQDKLQLFSEVASGVGKVKSSAIQDALKNAVQQSFGVFVASKESLKDGKFSEEVLTNSSGFIESYDLTGSRVEGDTYNVTIHARISSQKIISQLEKTRIPMKSGAIEIAINLNEKLNKRIFERDREAREAELLLHALRGMPELKEYFTARIANVKEIDLEKDRDHFAIRTEVRYEYDWNKILTFNRQFDRLLRLSKISKSSREVKLHHQDLELVSKSDATHKLPFHEKRDIEFGKATTDKIEIAASDKFFSIPLLMEVKLALPEKFPKSGFQDKLVESGLSRKRYEKTIRQKLENSSVDCRWIVHQVNKEVWNQMIRKRGIEHFSVNAKIRKSKDDLPILATAYGIKPFSPFCVQARQHKQYFKSWASFCDTAPIKIIWAGKSFKLPIGETQSIQLSVDDLEKPSAPPHKAVRKKYIFSDGMPIPWQESVRLSWGDGTPLLQPLAKWETTDGKSFQGRFVMLRRKGQIAVIRLKDSTAEIDIPVAKLTKASARQLPVSVSLQN